MRLPFRPLTVAAAIEGLEGLALVGFAAYIAVEAIVGTPSSASSAWALAVTSLVIGVGTMFAARALHGCRRWARGTVVATQIFALPVAVSFLQAGRSGAGALLAAAAVAGLVSLFCPATTRQLLGKRAGG